MPEKMQTSIKSLKMGFREEHKKKSEIRLKAELSQSLYIIEYGKPQTILNYEDKYSIITCLGYKKKEKKKQKKKEEKIIIYLIRIHGHQVVAPACVFYIKQLQTYAKFIHYGVCVCVSFCVHISYKFFQNLF